MKVLCRTFLLRSERHMMSRRKPGIAGLGISILLKHLFCFVFGAEVSTKPLGALRVASKSLS